MRVLEEWCALVSGVFAILLMRHSSAFLIPSGVYVRGTRIATNPLSTAPSSRPSARAMASEGGASFGDLDGTDVRVGIISTRWNEDIVTPLTDGVKQALKECNVTDSNVFETKVPGSFELPLAARFLALSQTVDAIVCVGCLIKGDTMHFEYISESTCQGLMDVSIMTATPVIMGVLTCTKESQAIERSKGDNNHGIGWGKTAVEMGLLRMSATGMGKSKGSGSALGFGKSLDEASKEGAIPGTSPKPKIGF